MRQNEILNGRNETEETGPRYRPTFNWFRKTDKIVMIIMITRLKIIFIMQHNGVFCPLLSSVSFTQIIMPTWKIYIARRASVSGEMLLFLTAILLWSIWRKPGRTPQLLGYSWRRLRGILYMEWSANRYERLCVGTND